MKQLTQRQHGTALHQSIRRTCALIYVCTFVLCPAFMPKIGLGEILYGDPLPCF